RCGGRTAARSRATRVEAGVHDAPIPPPRCTLTALRRSPPMRRTVRVMTVATLTSLAGAAAAAQTGAAPPHPCPATAENRQLDFWIGRWDVAPWNAPAGTPQAAAGTNAIEPNLQQCALIENWHASNGSEGKSLNFYDINQKKWRQIWVADGGGSLDYSGEFRDGAMHFEGWTLGANGTHTLQRLTFTPFGRDTVRQTFSSSINGGKTWAMGFDARYVRQGAPPAAKDEVYRSPGGSTLRLMLSDANLGSEVSMGELTIPPNSDSGEHTHGAI